MILEKHAKRVVPDVVIEKLRKEIGKSCNSPVVQLNSKFTATVIEKGGIFIACLSSTECA